MNPQDSRGTMLWKYESTTRWFTRLNRVVFSCESSIFRKSKLSFFHVCHHYIPTDYLQMNYLKPMKGQCFPVKLQYPIGGQEGPSLMRGTTWCPLIGQQHHNGPINFLSQIRGGSLERCFEILPFHFIFSHFLINPEWRRSLIITINHSNSRPTIGILPLFFLLFF